MKLSAADFVKPPRNWWPILNWPILCLTRSDKIGDDTEGLSGGERFNVVSWPQTGVARLGSEADGLNPDIMAGPDSGDFGTGGPSRTNELG